MSMIPFDTFSPFDSTSAPSPELRATLLQQLESTLPFMEAGSDLATIMPVVLLLLKFPA